MARVLATALALVNWRGVFYERYLLDPNVTALEGPNGAGKTTVMVAAYLVLLPDLHRLRFSNVGEGSAAGPDRGIWGRLGEPERPSYSLLRVQLPNGEQRCVGVHIEKKREPAMTLTPLMITGIADDVPMSRFLLKDSEAAQEIPTLGELRELVAKAGGQLQVFRTTRDYFSTLFELGISPLRLFAEDERAKFNEMLRTSMTGGISRALTQELRFFMLKEDGGLGDTLGRLKESLRSCHATRVEVTEARALEQEITAVYEAGHTLFTAAVLGARARYQEAQTEQGRWGAARDAAAKMQRNLRAQLEQAEGDAASFQGRLQMAQEAQAQAEAELAAASDALGVTQELERLQSELQELGSTEATRRAELTRTTAARDQARALAREARSAAREGARGLSDVQRGLDELSRKANAYRRVNGRIEALAALLARDGVTPDELPSLESELSARLEHLDAKHAARVRERSERVVLKDRRERAIAALVQLGGDAGQSDLVFEANRVLMLAAERSERAASLRRREEELQRFRKAAGEWQELIAEGAALDVEPERCTSTGFSTELRDTETALDSAQRDLQSCERELGEYHLVREAARMRAERLQHRAARYGRAKALAEELSRNGVAPETAEALSAWLEESGREVVVLDRRARQLLEEREQAMARAAALHAPSGALNEDLLRIREEVGGELLVDRYQHVAPELAAALEVRLGPLAEAIVVDDPLLAARKCLGQARSTPRLCFVAAGAPLLARLLQEAVSAKPLDDDVVFEEEWGASVAHLPAQPSLGRDARRAQAKYWLNRAEALTVEYEACERELAAFRERRDKALLWQAQWAEWEAGDPALELGEAQAVLERDLGPLTERAAALATDVEHLQRRAQRLSTLVRRANAVSPVSEASVSELEATVQLARQDAQWLESHAESRAVLAATLSALGDEPPSDEVLALWESEAQALSEERDRAFSAIEVIRALLSEQAAFAWEYAVSSLNEQERLLPALEQAREQAELQLATAEDAETAAEVAREAAREAYEETSGRRLAADSHAAQLKARLGAVYDSPERAREALERARRALAAGEPALRALLAEERQSLAVLARLEERRRQADAELLAAESALGEAEARLEQREQAWQMLQAQAGSLAQGALASALADALADLDAGGLFALMRSKAQLFVDRLASAPRGAELAAALSTRLRDVAEEDVTVALELWQAGRAWLLQRLPAQFADAAEPLEALGKLSRELQELERRLSRQEDLLRGTSADVGRAIDVQVRRAFAQVRRINEYLKGIAFGGVEAISVECVRDETMDKVLAALRDGTAQQLLFQSTLPIDAALDELLRRYGGGRRGGARVLDYRHYVDLRVRVRRRGATDWELANPARVSTGEGIGVGAALMMVILREWERDARLMRDQPTPGTLRFLFLDEANRLSPDNLRVLFELCQALELQLLIAAPEVAHADGNTTYRLVRRDGADGREQVVVSGRRSSLPLVPPPGLETSDPIPLGQLELGATSES